MAQMRGETDADPMLPRSTEVNAARALHRKRTGERGARGVRAMRQVRQNGATATDIERGTEIATGTNHSPRVGTRQHPTGATPASDAGDTHPRARTHPATDQTVMTEKSRRGADLTHRKRLIPATTPTTAPCHPSRPTPGRSRRSPWRDRPGGGRAGRALAPTGTPRRAPSGARAGTSRPSTSTQTARRPSPSWTS